MAISTIEIQDSPVISPVHDTVSGKVHVSWVRWFQTVKKQSPFFSVNTAAGSVTIALPTFSTTAAAADYVNREHLYLKSSSDANTVTITGPAVGGSVVLTAQGQKGRFRFDGVNWWTV